MHKLASSAVCGGLEVVGKPRSHSVVAMTSDAKGTKAQPQLKTMVSELPIIVMLEFVILCVVSLSQMQFDVFPI